jgi:hypothetical protein
MLRLNFVPITPFAFVLFWSRKIRLFHIANSGKDGGIYIARDEEQNTKLTFVFFHLHIMQMYRVYSVQDFFIAKKKDRTAEDNNEIRRLCAHDSPCRVKLNRKGRYY